MAASVENFQRGFSNGLSGEGDVKLEPVNAEHFIPLFKRQVNQQPATKEDTQSIAAFERRIAAKFGG